jgi:hypothetical protein
MICRHIHLFTSILPSYHNVIISQINGSDPEIKELIDAYSIQVPSIKVFRRGIMADYRGPFDIPGITNYLREDSQVRQSSMRGL